MEETNQIEQPEVEAIVSGEQSTKKKRSTEADSDAGGVRLKLGGALGARVREAILELKGRGVNVTAEELLADHLERLPARYIESQLLKRTPERFYIETAIELPEIREKLIRQAKRSLGRIADKSGSGDAGTRRGKKPEDATAGMVQEG